MGVNWIDKNGPKLTLKDKIRELFKIRSKVVLVQIHELERIYSSHRLNDYDYYINNLYEHYIVKKLPKTYLCK